MVLVSAPLVTAELRPPVGAAVPVTVLAKDENYQPLLQPHLELVLARQGGGQETVRFDAVAESPGEYRAVLRPRQTGFYTLGSGEPDSEAVRQAFQVVPASVEREGPVDLAELEDLAAVPGGAVLDTPADLIAAAADIPSMRAVDTYRTPHPVWDTWITIAVLLSLLTNDLYRKARLDSENSEFFTRMTPSGWRDNLSRMLSAILSIVLAIWLLVWPQLSWPVLAAMLLSLGGIWWHLREAEYFWRQSVGEPSRSDGHPGEAFQTDPPDSGDAR